ncbi:ShET2/EspL2 family type III secretion system effector toxin, partial [Candidatus Ichthyocystis hellenicum]|uniref:ShET2/EspL2 family type III secretion system effector toxin n=1 Tax=Candidatus Ichthyocystis hellenicum TaxID=1561003 RepID=UPI001F5F5C2D
MHKTASTTISGEQRFFTLQSCNHVMSFKITHKIKAIEGVPVSRWVIHFFDPNKTNVVSRSEVLNCEEFLDSSRFSLRMFMTEGSYKDYFERTEFEPIENECSIHEYSDKKNVGLYFSTLETLSQDGISGCMIYHMMSSNISSFDIRGIVKSRSFSTLSADTRKEIFFAKSSSGVSALQLAMEQNNDNAIKSYDDFLEELSCDEQVNFLPDIINTKSPAGVPALFMAMQDGHVECINSFGLLINRLMNIRYRMSTEDFSGIVLDVLSAKRRDGLSALSMALFRNNYDSILAFGGLLDIIFVLKEINSIILSNIIFMLLNCKDGMGTHSMFYAFREGYTDTVFAFGALIDRLLFMKGHIPDNDMASMIFRLLNCENNDGAHGILYAFKEGYADTVRAFGTLIDKLLIMKGGIPDTDMADMIFKLLMPKFDTGSSGLLFSLQRMNIDTVVAFGELVSRFVLLRHGIPEVMFNSMMLEILTAKRSDGVPGIFLPLARNNINIVGAYNSLLAYAPKEVRKQIFCAKDSNGLPALYTLMFHNNPQSLTAYACFLQSLSCDEQIDLLPDILVSKNDSGTPALFIAMQEGYDTCVDAYASLIENKLMKIRDRISPYDFADIVLNIVLAKRSDGVSALLVGIYNNRVSAIEAYSRLLDKILLLLNGTVSYDKLADVVYIVISYCLPSCDTSSIFISMCRGQADSIIALGLLIDKLMLMKGRISHDRLARMIFKLLKARTIKNVDGLFMALQEGNTDAIVAFSSLVDKFLGMKGCVEDVVLVEMLFSLLICKSGDKGIPGLFMAMQNGHHSAVDAFRELLEKTMIFKENVSREYFNNMLLDIVTSRRSYGVSGLSVALKN